MEKVKRAWVYLRRGYAQLAFILSAMNFLVIQYRLLIEPTILHTLFPRFWLWIVEALLIGVPLLTYIGRLDYKRLTAPKEMEIAAKVNPWNQDFVKYLELLARALETNNEEERRKLLEEARKTIEKWRPRREEY